VGYDRLGGVAPLFAFAAGAELLSLAVVLAWRRGATPRGAGATAGGSISATRSAASDDWPG
jgi:hypothetical protein